MMMALPHYDCPGYAFKNNINLDGISKAVFGNSYNK
jgi:hypothetical protein